MINEVFGHLNGGQPDLQPSDLGSDPVLPVTHRKPTYRRCHHAQRRRNDGGFGLTHIAGVFDARMIRIYRLIGSSPTVLGTEGTGRDQISVGLWPYSADDCNRVAQSVPASPRTVAAVVQDGVRWWHGNIRFALSA